MANDIHERRKLVCVPLPQLLKLLFAPQIMQTYFTLPRCAELPEDAQVTGLQFNPDPQRNEVMFVVRHKSFPIVEEDFEPERLKVNWVMIEIARAEDKEKP